MTAPLLPTHWDLQWEWQLCRLLSSNRSAPNSPFCAQPGGSGRGLGPTPHWAPREGVLAGEGRKELPFPVALSVCFLFISASPDSLLHHGSGSSFQQQQLILACSSSNIRRTSLSVHDQPPPKETFTFL